MCVACEPETRPIAAAAATLTFDDPDRRAVQKAIYEHELSTGALRECRCGTVFRPSEDYGNLRRGAATRARSRGWRTASSCP